MKLLTLTGSVIAISLAVSSIAHARNNKNDPYLPPEHISCSLNSANQLDCGNFEHKYLSEGYFNASFTPGQEQTFTFASAAAYPTNNQGTSIFFTYFNDKREKVRLETIDHSIQPDLNSGSWKLVGDDVYICTEGYMSCGITHLPA